MKTVASDLKGARYALWKNPEDLTANQNAQLSMIAVTNKQLYRAYLLKEQFRQVFKLRGEAGIAMLKAWLAWASRCQIPAFVTLAKTIRRLPAGHRSRPDPWAHQRPGGEREHQDPALATSGVRLPEP
jgi:transposase